VGNIVILNECIRPVQMTGHYLAHFHYLDPALFLIEH